MPDGMNGYWVMHEPDWQKMMLTMIGLILGLIALISMLLALRYRPPAKDPAAVLYRRFTKKAGLEPGIGETAQRFARRAIQAGALPAHVIQSHQRDILAHGQAQEQSLSLTVLGQECNAAAHRVAG